MEPETPTPQRGPEQAPAQYVPNLERTTFPPTPESGMIETGAERSEQSVSGPAPTSLAALPTILPTPVVMSDPAIDPGVVSDAPIVANDDDLIEKEWVEKAKKIVAQTRDDPYKREAAVSQLQRDYLRKRYGRELGDV